MLYIKKKNILHGIWGFICVFCFLSFLIFGDRLSSCVNNSLILCAKRLIPSLFPLMIASRLLLSCGAEKIIGKALSLPCRYILGLSEGGSFAFLMGLICGFPLGAVLANSLYEKGVITSDELSLLVVSSSIPSLGFVVGVIGSGLLGSRHLGFILYISAILSAIITGVIYRFTLCHGKVFCGGEFTFSDGGGIIGKFCDAVVQSVKNMLSVCGFIVFFSLLCEVLSYILLFFGTPKIVQILAFGIMELTRGSLAAAEISGDFAFILCGAFIGWSGLCAMSQILSVCRNARVNILRFLGFKLVFAFICSSLAFFASIIF